MLLILIPSSYIVASKRVVVNIIYFSNTMSTKAILLTLNNVSKDVNMDVPKKGSNMLSCNTSREVSANSSIFSISYVNKIEAQDLSSF